jgi:AraC family transcriptional activator of pobA
MAETRDIPDYPLTDYVQPEIAELGLYVGRFEVLNTQMDRPPGMHRHGHFELFWLHGPAGHFNDFEHFKLPAERPSFILVSPGQLHRWEGADDIRGTLISFTTAFFDGREPPPSRLMEMGFVNRMAYPPALTADEQLEAEAQPLVARCEAEFATRSDGWMDMCRQAIRMILISAGRAWLRHEPETRETGRSRQLLQRFQSEVEHQFRQPLSVAAYAKRLGVTAGHLNDVVRQFTAGTAGELIHARELLEARRLLLHTELSVSEIAYELGYKDPSYFSRVFRKSTGQAPADFRAGIREACQGTTESVQ